LILIIDCFTTYSLYLSLAPLGKETAVQANEWFSKVIATLVNKHPHTNLVTIAYGTVITLFVAQVAGLEPLPLWKRLGLQSFVVLSLPKMELLTIVENVY
jgi:broad specificity phosphatase PhoE